MSPVAGVDLGKTSCRATTEDEHGNGRRPPVQGPGAPGLAQSNGPERAVDAVWTTLVRTLPDPRVLDALGVGAAGAEAAPETATQLARELSSRLPQATVAVTSDSLAAHAGGLGGWPGTVLAAGTGSVAVGLGSDGQLWQVDGWGPWLGDEGSGAWIGRQGLRAVLRHHDGRGPGTEFSGLAVRRFGELTLLPRTICADGDVARTAASFAPDVLAAAEGGDRAAGTALDGALLLASRADLPHESRVARVRPGTTGRDAVVATCGADVDLLALDLAARDLVVGISASDRTPYVLAALEAARSVGCRTVAVVTNAGTPVAAGADVAIELLTGAEVIAGSTRLKAGTAQKVTLNALSTGAMVRHGQTYGAWMVDVVASNGKLRRRARRILRKATGADDDRATAVLAAAGWHTKTALVALVADVDVRAATALLDAGRGRVRAALQLSSAGREEPG